MALPVVAASIAVPLIASALANKFGPALATKLEKPMLNPKTGVPYKVGPKVGLKVPTAGSKFIRGASSLGGIPLMAASIALPYILSLLGRGTQAASIGAGAGVSAASKIPLNFSYIPENKINAYGMTPGLAAAKGLSGMGDAAGILASGVGTAAGQSLSDIGKALQFKQIGDAVTARATQYGKAVKGLNFNPSDAEVVSRMLSAGGRAQ